jgi:protein TonB
VRVTMTKGSFVPWVICSMALHGAVLVGAWLVLRSTFSPQRRERIGQIITAEIFHTGAVGTPPAAAPSRPSQQAAARPAVKSSVGKNDTPRPPAAAPVAADVPGPAAPAGGGGPMPPGQASQPPQLTPSNSTGSSVSGNTVPGRTAAGPAADAQIIAKIHSIVSKSVVYPPAALRGGFEGVVKVSFRVAGDGRPVDIRVEVTSGYGILDEAAVKAVEKGKTYPVIAKTVVIPVRFSLK